MKERKKERAKGKRKKLQENLCVCCYMFYILFARSMQFICSIFLCISRWSETRRRYKMMHTAEFYNKVVKKHIFSDDDQLTRHTHIGRERERENEHTLAHSHELNKISTHFVRVYVCLCKRNSEQFLCVVQKLAPKYLQNAFICEGAYITTVTKNQRN